MKDVGTDGNRNKRDVWTIATKPYADAHFATWPEALVQPMVLAGTSTRGCCPSCGSPWVRLMEKVGEQKQKWGEGDATMDARMGGGTNRGMRDGIVAILKTTGWRPTCECGVDSTVPCRVLDPFAGSGTTGAVALKLGRSATLIELNPEYVELIRKRCRVTLCLPGMG